MLESHNNNKIIGLEEIENKLYNNFINNKLHHSILFLGQKGIGKSTLCYHLSNKILNFETSLKNPNNSLFNDNNDLFKDNPTFNLIKTKTHPDLLTIEKEEDQKTHKLNSEIKISSLDKITDFIHISSSLAKYKIIIIDSIDEMNIPTQNSILKILEEPIKNKFLFLVCHNKNYVLDTILSRCEIINIPSPTFNNWKKILTHIYNKNIQSNESELKNIYNLSNASIYGTINILNNNGVQIYNQIEDLLYFPEINIENLQNFAEKISNDENLFFLFSNFIFTYLYNILKYFSIKEINNIKQNSYFILNNNEKTILNKIKFIRNILSDIKTYNLNKKHSVIVIFNELLK